MFTQSFTGATKSLKQSEIEVNVSEYATANQNNNDGDDGVLTFVQFGAKKVATHCYSFNCGYRSCRTINKSSFIEKKCFVNIFLPSKVIE